MQNGDHLVEDYHDTFKLLPDSTSSKCDKSYLCVDAMDDDEQDGEKNVHLDDAEFFAQLSPSAHSIEYVFITKIARFTYSYKRWTGITGTSSSSQ